MDVSLDDYIFKKKGGIKNKKTSLAGRLGQKLSPQRKKITTKFNVTGLGSIADARAKIGRTSQITDARQKIGGPKTQQTDLRLKVNKKLQGIDARNKIKARQGAKQQQTRQQQIVVTGLGRPIPSLVSTNRDSNVKKKGVQQIGGTLTKTVGGNFTKTVGGNFTKTVGGNLSKTIVTTRQNKGNKQQNRVKMTSGAIKITTQQQVDTTSAQQLPGFVKIKNDLYVPPPKPEPIVWQPPPQPQPQPQFHPQPQYVEPVVYDQPMGYEQPMVDNVYQSIQYHQEPVQPEPVFVTRQQVNVSQIPPQVVTDTGGPYRVMVTNLHPVVTQDDLVELFGSIGALKRARLLKPGVAEILYMKKEDAVTSCKKYHMRELDGQPMQVNMSSLMKKQKQQPSPQHQPLFSRHRREEKPPPLEPVEEDNDDKNYEPLRLGAADKPGPSKMDIGLVHKALFKTVQPGQPNRPVTFTVKI